VKGVAIVAAITASWLLPAGWAVLAISVIAVLAIGFLTYAIVHPRSQFFAPVVYHLAADRPVVALTFDDGPDPTFTPQILDVLAEHHAHATFFVLGARAAQYPEIVRRIHREGHAVGTHTQSHRVGFHFASPRSVAREIVDAIAVVGELLHEQPTLFRPPQGLRTPLFGSAWRRLRGLTCVTWSVRGLDSLPTTPEKIVARIMPRLEPGAIITLHDGGGLGGGTDRTSTVAALITLLGLCSDRGLRCIALDSAALRSGGAHA
jgi:peptidoglycan/xylan/chitin deacetylase (PgdA/CDA1 family)